MLNDEVGGNDVVDYLDLLGGKFSKSILEMFMSWKLYVYSGYLMNMEWIYWVKCVD